MSRWDWYDACMNANEDMRDDLGDELEQFAKRIVQYGQPMTAACVSFVAGAVYSNREMALARWIVWFVRWEKLRWWVQERTRKI